MFSISAQETAGNKTRWDWSLLTCQLTTQLRLDQRFSKYGMHINNGHMAHSYIHGHRVFCCSFNEHRASGTALYSLGATTWNTGEDQQAFSRGSKRMCSYSLSTAQKYKIKAADPFLCFRITSTSQLWPVWARSPALLKWGNRQWWEKVTVRNMLSWSATPLSLMCVVQCEDDHGLCKWHSGVHNAAQIRLFMIMWNFQWNNCRCLFYFLTEILEFSFEIFFNALV